MIPVDQLYIHDPENGVIGDCMHACLASILEIPITDVPDFRVHFEKESSCDWWNAIIDWLDSLGYEIYPLPSEEINNLPPSWYYIASGPTKRFGGKILHVCIGQDGKIVHDPHPSRDGLTKITYIKVIIKKD